MQAAGKLCRISKFGIRSQVVNKKLGLFHWGAMRVADVDDWPGSGMSRTAWLVRPGGRVAEAKHTPGQGLAARRPCGRHAAVSLTICSLHSTESYPVGGLRGGFPITSHVPTTSHWPSCHPPAGGGSSSTTTVHIILRRSSYVTI